MVSRSALRLGEDNARFLLLFVVMVIYLLLGAGLFSLLERDREAAERRRYLESVRSFLDAHPSVNRSALDGLLASHAEAGVVVHDDVITRWDFPGSFHFVSTIVTTIGEHRSYAALCFGDNQSNPSIFGHNFCNKKPFERCSAHSPLRAAARRLFYIAIHQVSLLSHAACAAMSTTTTTTTTTTTRDRGDRYGLMEWAR